MEFNGEQRCLLGGSPKIRSISIELIGALVAEEINPHRTSIKTEVLFLLNINNKP